MAILAAGDRVIIGASQDNDNGGDSGSAYVFDYNDDPCDPCWLQSAKLLAQDGQANDYFGTSVALDGDFAIIGADGDDDNGDSSGSAYIFRNIGGLWLQKAKLTPLDPAAQQFFGASVALSNDQIVIGAAGDSALGDYAGAAYVFERADDLWNQINKLTAGDASAYSSFGSDVSVSGSNMIIGAKDDGAVGVLAGSIYTMEDIPNNSWTHQLKRNSSVQAALDQFGSSVAISSDYAVAGTNWLDPGYRGHACVFESLPCDPVDLNCDGYLNLTDVHIFSDNWLATGCGAPDWCQQADITGRILNDPCDPCAVDFDDFSFIADKWGQAIYP